MFVIMLRNGYHIESTRCTVIVRVPLGLLIVTFGHSILLLFVSPNCPSFLRQRRILESHLETTRVHLAEVKTEWHERLVSLESQIEHLNTKIAEDAIDLNDAQRCLDEVRTQNSHKCGVIIPTVHLAPLFQLADPTRASCPDLLHGAVNPLIIFLVCLLQTELIESRDLVYRLEQSVASSRIAQEAAESASQERYLLLEAQLAGLEEQAKQLTSQRSEARQRCVRLRIY
ncbi:unnamed protein product [Protopolystoma xenopodis]|uniref:Uncharacterized protein n=1 Tax=Protopolystoma xenopodis TaxID=117903 RepID=A0A448XAS1_9PLAT|nr:unnamed protein product [Protopolystoma xenopodis]